MRVAVLAGGPSLEREVSLLSGHRVQAALAASGHQAVLLDPASGPLVEALESGEYEAVYVALHGKLGEDGTVQRLLELLRLPYTGTRPFACQVAFDKGLAKEALLAAGVDTPPWAIVSQAALRDLGAGAAIGRVADRLDGRLVVKPARGGSALGVKFVERPGDLPAAVMGAMAYADAVVVERRIEGTEVAVSLLGDPAEPLPPVEIVPKGGVFDYAARYTAGATEYFVPARLGEEALAACSDAAGAAFRALGLRDVARADLMVDGDGRPWVLELNVSPGMTETSLLPLASQAAGMPFERLCERVLDLTLARDA
ncbi:MAG: D-alanine--D-alanine ligase [Actinomycetota bacterium]